MLLKLADLLFKCLVGSWTVAFLSFCLLILVHAAHFRRFGDLHPVLGYIAAIAVGMLIWLIANCGQRKRKERLTAFDLYKEILSGFPRTAIFLRVGLLVTNFLFAYAITFSMQFIIWNSGLVVAFVAQELNCHELAERVLWLTPDFFDRKEDISMAALEQHDPGDPDYLGTQAQTIQSVKDVYGERSRQLCHLYIIVGEKYRASAVQKHFADDSTAATQLFAKSAVWYGEALELNRLHGNRKVTIEALSNLAYCALRQGQRTEAASILTEAMPLVHDCTEDGLARLSIVSHETGDEKLATHLYQLERKFRASQKGEGPRDFTLYWPQFALIMGALMLTRCFGMALLHCLAARKWKRVLATAEEDHSKIHALNMLTTLALDRRDFKQAEAYSIELLRTARRACP